MRPPLWHLQPHTDGASTPGARGSWILLKQPGTPKADPFLIKPELPKRLHQTTPMFFSGLEAPEPLSSFTTSMKASVVSLNSSACLSL